MEVQPARDRAPAFVGAAARAGRWRAALAAAALLLQGCLLSVDGLTGSDAASASPDATADGATDATQDARPLDSGAPGAMKDASADASVPDAAPRDGASADSASADSASADSAAACVPLAPFDASYPGMACDAGSDDDAGNPTVCNPESVAGFMSAWVAPNPHQAACTPDQMNGFVVACIAGSGATAEGCEAYQSANVACYDCLNPPILAGPLLFLPTYTALNYGGCVALSEPCNQPCAEVILDDFRCLSSACDTSCPFGTAGRDDCQTQAGGCGCLIPTTLANDCIQVLQENAGAAAGCFVGTTFNEKVVSLAAYFCGIP